MTLTQLKYIIFACLQFIVITSAYYQGKSVVQQDWDLANAIISKQITELETAQAELTTKVVTEYVDRTKIVKQKGDTIIEYVDKYVSKDNDCRIPNNVISLLDSAMQNRLPNSTESTDATPSGINLAEVASNTAGNYTTCYQTREQLITLQDWINKQQEVTNASK